MPALLLISALLAPPANERKLTVLLTDEAVQFRHGDAVVTQYEHAGKVQAEKGAGRQPLAKPYFYPLSTPAGVVITRGWPISRLTRGETTDHFHQKSAWFCHGDVIPEGLTWAPKSKDKHVEGVDFWTELPGHGVIRCDRVEGAGPEVKGRAGVATRNTWLTPDGQTILTEVRELRLKVLPAGFLLEIDSTLTAAVPVTFGDTKEGSLGVRVRDELTLTAKGSAGVVTSSNKLAAKAPAKDNLPLWGEVADWHDYSGKVDGKVAGIAVFDHPKNSPRAAWHTRAYGLMAANPFAREKSGFPGRKVPAPRAALKKGESLTLRYGLYLHDGDAAAGKVAEAYAAFAE